MGVQFFDNANKKGVVCVFLGFMGYRHLEAKSVCFDD
jgi:hypothetical protein